MQGSEEWHDVARAHPIGGIVGSSGVGSNFIVGKALISTYVRFLNETSLSGCWTLKPIPNEEKELAHLYERHDFPYPGDTEAVEEFIAKGGMIGTSIGPKEIIETDRDSYNFQKDLQDKKLDQEAMKLWVRMRRMRL
ncbi:uncharacterized protein LOC125209785 [Salvia hispanica]|uniref:uncharacterized protein LOC125209785 n=1 Tax=Salvia hispanica TaxID=49212 RepID=UPI002009661A|nr:uncharacterized protein LOC125209785 [Salvia hispanica]